MYIFWIKVSGNMILGIRLVMCRHLDSLAVSQQQITKYGYDKDPCPSIASPDTGELSNYILFVQCFALITMTLDTSPYLVWKCFSLQYENVKTCPLKVLVNLEYDISCNIFRSVEQLNIAKRFSREENITEISLHSFEYHINRGLNCCVIHLDLSSAFDVSTGKVKQNRVIFIIF